MWSCNGTTSRTEIKMTKRTVESLLRSILLQLAFFCCFITSYAQENHACGSKKNNNEKKVFKRLPPVKETSITGITRIKDVTIQYLGAGGVLIAKGDNVVAIDPFFSNKAFSFGRFIRGKKSRLIKPDTTLIKELSPKIKNLKDANAVFITHAHYDHLLDVPYLYKKVFVKNPVIYGNNSTKAILKNLVPPTNLVSVHTTAAQHSKPEIHWINVGTNIRVMPILSDHAPHYKFVKFFDGETIASPTEEEYYKGTDPLMWKEGRTLAYLVEIMDGNDTLRIHVQTSACTPTEGLPPLAYKNIVGKVDIVMFCMPSFDNVESYPDSLIRYLNPTKLIIVHWEDFFEDYNLDREPTKYKIVPYNDAMCFIDIIEGIIFPATIREKCLLPVPGAFIRVE